MEEEVAGLVFDNG